MFIEADSPHLFFAVRKCRAFPYCKSSLSSEHVYKHLAPNGAKNFAPVLSALPSLNKARRTSRPDAWESRGRYSKALY